ncbi:hypothetical protein BXZ70DRAFT_1007282 [Cristinia sonorae]|uniref:Small EDRK-rich factor-like N-terminal domain-containing protein n=1 Tax=Cristinia sonorae TaxID=1940300 RepID=A0A8K0UPD1_9AGAR|nr:hypothetical protein BXZ70DRAFT_1007282 [Cristinia sonorae]
MTTIETMLVDWPGTTDIGGNQREMDRLKAQKKAAANAKKPKESAASLQARKERDAQTLREKQLKKEAEKAGGGGGGEKPSGGSKK